MIAFLFNFLGRGGLYYTDIFTSTEELIERAKRVYNGSLDEIKRFRYEALSSDAIEYSVLVTKKWPDPRICNMKFEKVGSTSYDRGNNYKYIQNI